MRCSLFNQVEPIPHSSSARIDKPNIPIKQKHEIYKKGTTLEYFPL